MCLRFLKINIYGHTAVTTPILRLRLALKTEIQSEIIETKNHWNTNRFCNKTNISPLLVTNLFVHS